MSEETGALKLEEKPNNSKSAKSKKLFSLKGISICHTCGP